MWKLLQRKFEFIPVHELQKALEKSKIPIEDHSVVYKEGLVRYYNSKLLSHLKYQQWVEFFYLYKTAKTLDHGTNTATHIIAAHGFIMAYSNTIKAFEILEALPPSPAVTLTKNIIKSYEELKKLDIAPNSPDWAVVVNICAGAANERKDLNKWDNLLQKPRTDWHYSLRPWKYPRHLLELKNDERFKQRGEK